MHSGGRHNVPISAVLQNNAWATVVVRQTSDTFELATCSHRPCQTLPWDCIYAKEGNKVARADASSTLTRSKREREDALLFGPNSVLKEEDTTTGPSPAAPPPRR